MDYIIHQERPEEYALVENTHKRGVLECISSWMQ